MQDGEGLEALQVDAPEGHAKASVTLQDRQEFRTPHSSHKGPSRESTPAPAQTKAMLELPVLPAIPENEPVSQPLANLKAALQPFPSTKCSASGSEEPSSTMEDNQEADAAMDKDVLFSQQHDVGQRSQIVEDSSGPRMKAAIPPTRVLINKHQRLRGIRVPGRMISSKYTHKEVGNILTVTKR